MNRISIALFLVGGLTAHASVLKCARALARELHATNLKIAESEIQHERKVVQTLRKIEGAEVQFIGNIGGWSLPYWDGVYSDTTGTFNLSIKSVFADGKNRINYQTLARSLKTAKEGIIQGDLALDDALKRRIPRELENYSDLLTIPEMQILLGGNENRSSIIAIGLHDIGGNLLRNTAGTLDATRSAQLAHKLLNTRIAKCLIVTRDETVEFFPDGSFHIIRLE